MQSERQNIKRQRIKQYFLEAAKSIIMKEGHESVSVRKVADIAGYSYATIYNYFTDLNALLWEVKTDMIEDVGSYLRKRMPSPPYNTDSIRELFRVYMDYHLKNPNVFAFFYFVQLTPARDADTDDFGSDSMWEKVFEDLVTDGTIAQEDVLIIAKTFVYAVHGMLLLYFSNSESLNKQSMYDDLDRIAYYILG